MKMLECRKSPVRGFSLIEIVLALGIVSFAIVGIMGLFPVAMKSAQESQRETRAAQIARGIFDDLQSLPGTNTALIRGPSITNAVDRITGINLATASTHILGYDQQGTGLSTVLSAGQFDAPLTQPELYYLAKIEISPRPSPSKLSQVSVNVEVPAFAVSSNRSRFLFVTLMDQR
jgi:uncharacterized protein (TIGR02598 family)